MTDVWRLLPHFSWRGQVYPIVSREVSFTHEGVRHKLQYRDGEIIEQTGSQALTFSYQIPMREDISRGPYQDLFNQFLAVLFRDVQNRVVGPLVDPIYGTFNCIPTSYRDTSDPNKRDGTDVSVEFSRTLTTDDIAQAPAADSLEGVNGDVRRLDDELKLVPGFENFVAKQGTTDLFSALAGVGRQIQGQGQRFTASLQDLSSRMDKLDRAATALENPQLWGAQDAARSVRDSAVRLAKHGENPGQRVLVVTQRYGKTVGAVAASVGMTTYDLLRLNPGLAKSPIVPKDYRVRVFG